MEDLEVIFEKSTKMCYNLMIKIKKQNFGAQTKIDIIGIHVSFMCKSRICFN